MMGDGGFPPIPPSAPPLQLDPSWPPKTIIAGDSVADELLGKRKEPTVSECFQRIITAIMKTASEERGAVLSELTHTQARCEEYLDNWRAAHRADLERKRSDIYKACRLVSDHVKDLKTQQGRASSQFNAAAGRLNGMRNEAGAIQQARPTREDYPTPAEVAIWQAAVNEVAVRLDETQLDFDAARAELVRITGELAVETAKLDEYAEREKLLSAQIEGREWTEENGLVHPAAEEF